MTRRTRRMTRDALALAGLLTLAGCFPYTPTELRPPADAPAPPPPPPSAP